MNKTKSSEVVILFIAEVKPDMQRTFESFFGQNIAKSRAEPGILAFDLFKIDNRPGCYALVERYADQAAVDQHMATAHAQAAFELFKQVLTQPAEELICFGTEIFPPGSYASQ